jgi:hypothetical protein
MLEDTKDYAGELDVSTAAAPVVPVAVDQAPKPPKPPKPPPAPNKQVDVERVLGNDGKTITGLRFRPKPGNAIVMVTLTDPSQDGKFRVAIETEPRRGRAFRSTRKNGT